jgi:hypothetical protein
MAKGVVVCLEDLEDFGTTEEKIEHLHSEIKETTKLFNKEGKASVESAVRLGSMLIILKELVNSQEKKSWQTYLSNKSPVNLRTAQRCMKLARALGGILQKNAKLSWAGKSRLEGLARLVSREKTTVEALFDQSNISLDFNPKKVKEVKEFNQKIDTLIDGNKPEKKPKKKTKSDGEGTGNPISQLEEVVETCSSQLEKKKSREKLLYGLTSEGIDDIIGKVKTLLKKLKSAKEQISDEDTLEEAA